MGIPGLYNLIGKPERVSLSKLAAEHYEKTGRKFRLAIDASIWLFQVKASQGGANPELRTLYYRLIRLLRLGIDSVLVFDGKGRPNKKRNKKIAGSWESPRARQARALLGLFGFVCHHAPGEAEAECALLQKNGIVDAVFTEDGDTLMFGATMIVRNWKSHEKRGSKSPTHVDVYRADQIKASSSLDREGMVLIALMSGADYDTVGIKDCGSVIAYEAARAGFGHDLHEILNQSSGTGNLDEWRERLVHELKVNESGFFKRRAVKVASGIKPSFPNLEIAASYLHPLVSSSGEVTSLETKLASARNVNVHELRKFVGEALEWSTLAGAKKYIRGLAPAILTTALLDQHDSSKEPSGLLAVCGSRTHSSSDGILESRVEIRPIDLVPIDLAAESLTRPSTEVNQADLETEEASDGLGVIDGASDCEEPQSAAPTKRRQPSYYDPVASEKFYIPEIYIRKGAPRQIALWEETLRRRPAPASPRKSRAQPKGKVKAKGPMDASMPHGAIEAYFSISKAVSSQSSQPEVSILSKVSHSTMRDVQSSVTVTPALTSSGMSQTISTSKFSHPLLPESVSRKNKLPISKSKPARNALSRSSSETQPICISDDELGPLPTQISILSTSERSISIPSSQTFASPASSQSLPQFERSSVQGDKSHTGLNVPQPGIRLRSSLPGAWDVQTAGNPAKRGRLLGPLEVVDLT